MARGNHSNGVFVTNGIAEIGTSATVVDGVGFTSLVVPVWDVKKMMVQGELKAESGGSSDVVFTLFGRAKDGGDWDTIAAFALTLAMDSTTMVYESGLIEVQGFHSIKLYSVENEDASEKALLVNLNWGKAYGSWGW